MEEALIAHLLADAELEALVGSRLGWLRRPQGSALPAVTLTKVGGERTYSYQRPSELRRERVQVDVWANTYAAAVAVSRAVEACLSGLRRTVADVEFQGAFHAGERQSFEDGTAGAPLYRVSTDYQVHSRAG